MEIYVFCALVAVGILIKVFQKQLPDGAYKIGLLLYVIVPFAGLADAIVIEWGRWIGNREFALFVVFSLLAGIGTGVGYHRLLTHRSFETTTPIRAGLIILGSMAMPTRAIDFAANHLKHHAFSDDEGDPHSPLDGLFHAHIGWLFKSPKVDRERYCKRLLEDPVIMFIDRTPMIWFSLGLIIPYLVAGWEGLLWGGIIRVLYHNHVTYAVNSICHTYGKRPFNTQDLSRNNWILGILAFGEGWHNNHHAFPGMASHGMGWRQLDINGLFIKMLARLQLAWNVKQPSADLIERRMRDELVESSVAD